MNNIRKYLEKSRFCVKNVLKSFFNIGQMFHEEILFVLRRSKNWQNQSIMASFVNFLKAALIPSVKAQEDVVNQQEVLKVNSSTNGISSEG